MQYFGLDSHDDRRADDAAAGVREAGVPPGGRVLLLLGAGHEPETLIV
jgi:non-ribosomal peptide synthetase component E (peptide arylation enzyme)